MRSCNFKNCSRKLLLFNFVLLFLFSDQLMFAQVSPELETTLMKMGRVWIGVKGNASKSNFDFRAGFFPNDYNILGYRGQYAEANNGAGFKIATASWYNPYPQVDSVQYFPIYGPTTEYTPIGKVIEPLTNYIRYKFPDQEINFEPVELQDFGEYDPSKFGDYTYDQIVEVKNEYIYGITLKRKIMTWGQQFNDNYNIYDLTFENPTTETFDSLYINLESNQLNAYTSYGSNPYVASAEQYNRRRTWQHYYGGRVGDSLRVFYEYSADDPDKSGDNMGAPVISQTGRLIGSDLYFKTFLHASKKAYINDADDEDDFLQPKVTYVGTSTKIPYNSDQDDQFGSKNAWALAGGYSDFFPMSGNTWPGTHHGGNTDELGTSDYSNYPAGTKSSTNSRMACSFGPYIMAPGEKIRIVYAVGITGIGIVKAKEIGESWLRGTLEDAPNLPDPEKGFLPSEFVFPTGASDNDKRKDRWISTGIDSVMKSAYRVKWNFDHDYKIPQAPPPPSKLTVIGHGDGVEIAWSDAEAEEMDSFAGYRIMRRISNVDTSYYESVYDSDENDLGPDHVYKDQSILYGAQYYYYVQAKAKIPENDMNADPASRGKIIYSSRLLVPDIFWVNPPRSPSDDMTQIRIVPNPYNINDPLLKTYGFTDQRGIIFFNLPGTCTIRIFTENGDLVQTIEHDSPVKAGSLTWDMLTSSQQVINSGMYVAVFEKPGGEIAYHKFIVVR